MILMFRNALACVHCAATVFDVHLMLCRLLLVLLVPYYPSFLIRACWLRTLHHHYCIICVLDGQRGVANCDGSTEHRDCMCWVAFLRVLHT